MRLSEYIELKNKKPWAWADEVGLPRSRVYAWLAGAKPTLKYLMLISQKTFGAVRPEDFDGDY